MDATPSNGRRYACPEEGCDKVFSSSSHMRRHVRNHRDDRAFSCTHCGQAFIRREVWKRHEALHINPQSSRPRIKPVRKVGSTPPQSAGSSTSGIPVLAPIPSVELETLGQQPLHSPLPIPSAHQQVQQPPNVTPHSQPLQLDDQVPTERDAFPHPPSPPLYLSFPSATHTQPHTQTQLIHPWPVAETGFPPTDAAHSIFPQLGIENWLDQILSDQATFSAVMATSGAQQPQQTASPFWSQHPAGPSAQEAEACMRLRDWFSEHGGRQCATALDLKRFARCLGAYWMNIDVQYPIIHRPTFSTLNSSPLLLLAIILLGATATGLDEDWTWAETVFPLARGLAFGPSGSDSRDRLCNLQSLALLSIVGQSMGQEAQDHAQALVSAALTLARRANIYEDRSRSTAAPAPSDDVQATWHHWIFDESSRRVGWLILMRDIEYASFFHQLPSRATSPFRLPVDLPSPEPSWDAPSAEVWSHTYSGGETLAAALKKAIHQSPGNNQPHAPDTEFAQLVLIYGLCALGWDVHKRDLIAPEIMKSGPSGLNSFLLRSFTTYALQSTPMPKNKKQESLQRCIHDVSFLAALESNMNTLLLQVFVGVTEVGTLQPVKPTDWIESRKVMRKWVLSDESKVAVSLSAQFLGQAIETERQLTFNGAWAIYSAFLVCWSYYVLTRINSVQPMHPSNGAPAKDDALRCVQALQAFVGDGEKEPDPALMRALSTQVVSMLSGRREVLLKSACALIDRHGMP